MKKIVFKMSICQKPNKKNGQYGATLIEVLIAAAIGLLVCVAGVYFLTARVKSVDDVQISKEAESSGENALTALTAIAPDLTDGGAFSSTTDNVLTISPCSVKTCDYVLLPEIGANSKTSPAKGFPYSTSIPQGYSIAFLRRWSVETTNADYHLRKITVAILKNETDTKPLLIASTIVGSGQQ